MTAVEEPDAQAQIELSVTSGGVRWFDAMRGPCTIPLDVAERIADQIDGLKEQARVQAERQAFVASLRAVADWVEGPAASVSVSAIQTIWLHVDEPADLYSLAAAQGAEVTEETLDYTPGWAALTAELSFGLVKVTLLGRTRVAQDDTGSA